MDVVDGQIIDTLRRLDPNFFDDLKEIPSSVAELSTETFYQAIVILLWSCKQSIRKEVPSKLLPQDMSAKFRCVTVVVDAVKANLNPFTDLIRSANCSDEERESSFTRYGSAQNHSSVLSTRVDFVGFSGDVMAALRCEDWRYRRSAFICSLLESNAISSNETQNYHSVGDEVLETSHYRSPGKRIKPRLKPKPLLPTELQQRREAKNKQEVANTSKESGGKSEVLNKLLNEVLVLTASVDRKKIYKSQMQSDEAERFLSLQNRKLREAEIDKRLKKLLEDPDALFKLESYIDGSNERMQHLQNVWLRAKVEKDEEVKAARLTALSSDYSLVYCNRKALAKDAKIIENELADRKKVMETLKRQAETQEEKQINRNIYMKHIFEIVGSIRKQQNEINKIAAENLCLQKEIRSSTGKLERSFTVVEGKLYKDVEKDTSMQKAYKLLMKIHGECSWVITGIDASGQLEREIEELNDLVAMQQQKNIDEKFECVVNDWMEIKKENMALKELLGECNS
uniref:Coiled-coil domain-containing protein 22 homolog n=1 Tax=Setaria digitata TaxID=48799 RepID=A0A915PUW5_9BILA